MSHPSSQCCIPGSQCYIRHQCHIQAHSVTSNARCHIQSHSVTSQTHSVTSQISKCTVSHPNSQCHIQMHCHIQIFKFLHCHTPNIQVTMSLPHWQCHIPNIQTCSVTFQTSKPAVSYPKHATHSVTSKLAMSQLTLPNLMASAMEFKVKWTLIFQIMVTA